MVFLVDLEHMLLKYCVLTTSLLVLLSILFVLEGQLSVLSVAHVSLAGVVVEEDAEVMSVDLV